MKPLNDIVIVLLVLWCVAFITWFLPEVWKLHG